MDRSLRLNNPALDDHKYARERVKMSALFTAQQLGLLHSKKSRGIIWSNSLTSKASEIAM